MSNSIGGGGIGGGGFHPPTGGVFSYAPPGCGATHFNLDQLLEIVQSFRLDTTHALSGGQGSQILKIIFVCQYLNLKNISNKIRTFIELLLLSNSEKGGTLSCIFH